MASYQANSRRSSCLVPPPCVLSIAGSDCSAGAGIQADLKTFQALGCYGLTAVTCVVAEVPGEVRSIEPISPAVVRDQVALLFEKFPLRVVKTGMLFSSILVEAVAEVLGNLKERPLLVIDPVMIASSGDALLERDAVEAYRKKLFPLAALITPNLDELLFLSKCSEKITTLEQMRAAGHLLLNEIGVSLLLKGGHLQGEKAADILLLIEGKEVSSQFLREVKPPEQGQHHLLALPGVLEEIQKEYLFSAPYIQGAETHGTGCTYSAAIAAGLAHGLPLSEAVARAKEFITQAIAEGYRWGALGALCHKK